MAIEDAHSCMISEQIRKENQRKNRVAQVIFLYSFSKFTVAENMHISSIAGE